MRVKTRDGQEKVDEHFKTLSFPNDHCHVHTLAHTHAHTHSSSLSLKKKKFFSNFSLVNRLLPPPTLCDVYFRKKAQ